MINILLKVKEFCKNYKKRIITVIGISILTITIIIGVTLGLTYSHAKSNIKYSQDQLQQIALGKVPGEVVNVKKELNFEDESFQYEFKIKDKENMLQEVKLDAQYGVILGLNNENHKKENKYGHDKPESRRSEH